MNLGLVTLVWTLSDMMVTLARDVTRLRFRDTKEKIQCYIDHVFLQINCQNLILFLFIVTMSGPAS